MPKLNKVSKLSPHLIADENVPFIRCEIKFFLLNSLGNRPIRRLFSKNTPYIEALEKAKPHPYFQNLPPASKKKKPLSRRVNHALITAI